MIHISVRDPEHLGPEGNVRIVGLEKSDLEHLALGHLLKFETPSQKFALIFVKGTKEELLEELRRVGHTDNQS
jgi:hypothetical protein